MRKKARENRHWKVDVIYRVVVIMTNE